MVAMVIEDTRSTDQLEKQTVFKTRQRKQTIFISIISPLLGGAIGISDGAEAPPNTTATANND